MIKANRLKKGDKVAIVSLSSGILGEPFVKHELDLGIKRLEELELVPVFMENSMKGIDFIKNHPEKRAEDLKNAFADNEIKAIICAIGGEDTYLTLPYLLNDETFKELVKNNPKIFLGFSDSTTNHLLLNKLGLITFYGQAFLTDLAEFEPNMLEYSKTAFDYLFEAPENYEIKPSPVWYLDRTDYSPNAVGTLREKRDNSKGYEVLKGNKIVSGKLLGGCIEILADYSFFETETHPTFEEIAKKYNPLPTLEEWKNSIMLIETGPAKMMPEKYRNIIKKFKEMGVMNQISGLVCGKPVDEVYYEEYKQVLIEELAEFDFPIFYNLNIGHAYPHAILPLGAEIELNPNTKAITIKNSALN